MLRLCALLQDTYFMSETTERKLVWIKFDTRIYLVNSREYLTFVLTV